MSLIVCEGAQQFGGNSFGENSDEIKSPLGIGPESKFCVGRICAKA